MQLPRFYPILDTSRVTNWLAAAEDAAAGGAAILQIRHKGPWTEEAVAAAGEIAKLPLQLIINDRADIAAMLGAGLHVGQADLPPQAARRLVRGPLGLSTHNAPQLEAAAAEPIDYVALGPVFPTVSKANPEPDVGLDRLRQWRPLTARPLVAIGGIDRRAAPGVLEAGADSVAVIRDWDDPAGRRERVREWVQLVR